MYGKIFASLYEGSLVGAGSNVFAVIGYIIAKQVPDRKVGSQVELNPKLLAFILGDTQERVQEAIDLLCAPDPGSRTKGDEGRRLVKIGEFSYRVVNGAKYRAIRDEEARREQNRTAQRKHREKVAEFPQGETMAQRNQEAYAKAGDDEAGERSAEIAEKSEDMRRAEDGVL